MRGKISALLELGAGFNQDYTGIENIYMNGTMMGYTKKRWMQSCRRFSILPRLAISSISRSRRTRAVCSCVWHLRFTINVEPEILIVDEALSVGDVFFQSKCYRRME